jgi:NAD(P)-dependent dehydrogenase (short-subunit alcohol dehydrogenase family)
MRPIRSLRTLTAACGAILIAFAISLPSAAQAPGNGRAVLVTGASSGIGLLMTERLAENGFYVYAGARSADDLARLDAMENVSSIRLDVTDQGEIDAAVVWVEAQGRGLYGLINNAGVAVIEPLVEISEDDMWFQQNVNVFGPWRVTAAFADMLIESRGRIMTTGSISGILPGQLQGAYSMSKHSVEAFTDVLADEMAQFGVEVAVVEPGAYDSDIGASLIARMERQGYDPSQSRWADAMRALMEGGGDRSALEDPTEVAMAALDFMASDTPKRRYMVVPNEQQAMITIRQMLTEMVQMNLDQEYTYSRDELVEMLDAILEAVEATRR